MTSKKKPSLLAPMRSTCPDTATYFDAKGVERWASSKVKVSVDSGFRLGLTDTGIDHSAAMRSLNSSNVHSARNTVANSKGLSTGTIEGMSKKSSRYRQSPPQMMTRP